MLEVRGLRAGYGGSVVIDGIDLDVAAGEFVVVIGPNGHGKTTLLRAISGLLPARSGTVAFKGEDITGQRTEAIVGRGLVQIPQGDLLFPDMSVQENLLLGAFTLGRGGGRADRLAEVYEIFPRLAERVLDERDLSRWSTRAGGWVLEPGTFEVAIGASSRASRSCAAAGTRSTPSSRRWCSP